MKKYFTKLMNQKRAMDSVKGLLLFGLTLFFVQAAAQEITVSGRVVDASDGSVLPGVTILERGTTRGTTTDLDGNYVISVGNGATLVFSFVGYVKQEMQVGQQSTINVSLELDVQALSEVVVVGYGKVEKGDITGVVNKVDSKEFNKGMLTSPEQLISGKVAGVQIASNSGEPGGGISIRMRGGTSLSASNEPLFVIDGIPIENKGVAGGRNPLNFINPSDIADITVLKDASAAAIYGSRGANGVIIITTKSGESGKLQVTYDGSYSISSNIEQVTMLTTPEYKYFMEEEGSRTNNDKIGDANTDWVDEILQTAQGQNHNIGLSGGGKTYNGRVTLNYQNLDGVLKTSNTERLTASLNFTKYFFNKDLSINVTSKNTVINNRFSPNVIGSALVFDPTQSIYGPDSLNRGYFEWPGALATDNPVASIDREFNIGKNYRNLIGANVNYNLPFLQGLSVKVNYAIDKAEGYSQNTQLPNDKPNRVNGWYSYWQDSRSSQLFESYLNYTTKFSATKADFIAGYSYQEFDNRTNTAYERQDTVSQAELGLGNPMEYASEGTLKDLYDEGYLRKPLTNIWENRLISFWGRANFTILDRYLITGTLRRDGSTRFGEENRWGLFPSVALGWRILDEPFMQGAGNVFTDLKLRVSWGVTGNQEIGDYLYLNLYQYGGDGAQYIIGNDTINTLRPNAVDPAIKWEETRSLNIGLDYGLLKGRLYGSIDVYRKFTSDLLWEIAFPMGTLTGDRAITNIGEIENKGVELLINSVPINKKDLTLNLTFNASYNKNEILKLDRTNEPGFQGYQVGGISGDVGQTIQILRVGESVNTFYVLEHKKVNGKPVDDNTDVNGDGIKNILDMYVDQLTVDTDEDGIPDSPDGRINQDDYRPNKNPAPDVMLGLTSNLTYKKFDLALTWRGQLGNFVYNNVFSQYGSYAGLNNSFSPNNVHVSAVTNNFQNKQLHSDIYIEDASFLKLDNVTLGYNFTMGSKIQSRAYFTATNILTLTGYSGVNPEAGINGIDNNLYPWSRTFLVGINVKI